MNWHEVRARELTLFHAVLPSSGGNGPGMAARRDLVPERGQRDLWLMVVGPSASFQRKEQSPVARSFLEYYISGVG